MTRITEQEYAEIINRRATKRADLNIEIKRDAQGKPSALAIGFSEQSELENTFDCQIRAERLPKPQYEFRFMPPRRFRFDRAWPEYMVAAEIEGATWSGGRHVRGKGYANDCEKYSEAAIRGWKVIRATGDMVKNGKAIDLLKRALETSPK